jgi:hypothetical protein
MTAAPIQRPSVAAVAMPDGALRGGHRRLCWSAEGVGFEPTVTLSRHSGFQDRRHRPLGEPSRRLNVPYVLRCSRAREG